MIGGCRSVAFHANRQPAGCPISGNSSPLQAAYGSTLASWCYATTALRSDSAVHSSGPAGSGTWNHQGYKISTEALIELSVTGAAVDIILVGPPGVHQDAIHHQ